MKHLDSTIDARPPVRRPQTVLGIAGRVVCWAVIASVVAFGVGTVAVPRLAGATTYTVLTGSMRPGLPPGTLVVVKPVAAEDVAVGSVITYQRDSGVDTVVTHRVVSQGFDPSGSQVWWTKGDANEAVDSRPVLPVQVRGELWYSVPYVGHLNALVTSGVRSVVVTAVAGALAVYAMAMFVGAARDRRRSRR
jgi:signal peptidase